jgi:hypothetical protein
MSGYFGFGSSSGGGGGGDSSPFGDLFPNSGVAAGFSDGNYLRPAHVHDLDTSGNQEFNLGVNLRTYSNGGSKEVGTNDNPLIINFLDKNNSFYGLSSNLFTELDLHNSYQIDQNIYSLRTSSGGSNSYEISTGSINLQTNASSGSLSEIRTNQYYKLQLGKTIIIRQGIRFQSSGTNNDTSFGLFDDNYGVYFKLSNSLLNVGFLDTMSTGVTNEYSSLNFNFDKLDGSGPSGIILDTTKYNLYEIRIGWNGVLFLDFYINGFLCHRIRNYNISDKPFFQIDRLPISIKSLNSNLSTATSVYYNSSCILIENGNLQNNYSFSISNDSEKTISYSDEVPLLSIRSKNLINTIENRKIIIPKLIGLFTQGNRIKYRLLINCNLVGASFNSVNTYSSVEYDFDSTSFTGGFEIYKNYLSKNEDHIDLDLKYMFNLYGRNLKQNAFATSTDILTIVVVSNGKVSTKVSSTILWNEE